MDTLPSDIHLIIKDFVGVRHAVVMRWICKSIRQSVKDFVKVMCCANNIIATTNRLPITNLSDLYISLRMTTEVYINANQLPPKLDHLQVHLPITELSKKRKHNENCSELTWKQIIIEYNVKDLSFYLTSPSLIRHCPSFRQHSFASVQTLNVDCAHIDIVPDIFPNLRNLTISQSYGSRFYEHCLMLEYMSLTNTMNLVNLNVCAFPKLKKLEVNNMQLATDNLKTFFGMPNLEHLSICVVDTFPNLQTNHLTCLKTLRISACTGAFTIPSIPSLTKLTIATCNRVDFLQSGDGFPKLEFLHISLSLVDFTYQQMANLRHIEIVTCAINVKLDGDTVDSMRMLQTAKFENTNVEAIVNMPNLEHVVIKTCSYRHGNVAPANVSQNKKLCLLELYDLQIPPNMVISDCKRVIVATQSIVNVNKMMCKNIDHLEIHGPQMIVFDANTYAFQSLVCILFKRIFVHPNATFPHLQKAPIISSLLDDDNLSTCHVLIKQMYKT